MVIRKSKNLACATFPSSVTEPNYTTFYTEGLPEWLCPALGASAVLWGRHHFAERLREHRSSHLCPVQQGKYQKHCNKAAVTSIITADGFYEAKLSSVFFVA